MPDSISYYYVNRRADDGSQWVTIGSGFTTPSFKDMSPLPNGADYQVFGVTATQQTISSTIVTVAGSSFPGKVLRASIVGYGVPSTANGLAVASNGDIVVVGFFQGTTDFDPAHGSHSPSSILTSVGATNMFIARYTSTGAYLWAVRFGNGTEVSEHVVIDSLGNIIVSGQFFSTTGNVGGANMDSTFTNQLGQQQVATNGFVAKYTSAGAFIWRLQIGKLSANTVIQALTLDGNDIYCGGLTRNTENNVHAIVPWFITGTDSVNSAAYDSGGAGTILDAFVAKISSTGVVSGTGLWGKGFWSQSRSQVTGLAVDSAHNLIIAGKFGGGLINLDQNSSTNALASNNGAGFIGKFNSSGTFIRQQRIGDDSQFCGVSSVAVDQSDNLLLVGAFQISINFGGPTLVTTSYGKAMWIARFNGNNGAWMAQYLIDCPTSGTSTEVMQVVNNIAGVYANGVYGGNLQIGSFIFPNDRSDLDKTFVAKFKSNPNQSDDLTPVWVDRLIATNNDGNVRTFSLLGGQTILCSGYITAQTAFGSNTLTPAGQNGMVYGIQP